MPNSESEVHNVRGVRSKAQRVTQRAPTEEDCAAYKKVDATFCRHTASLRQLLGSMVRHGKVVKDIYLVFLIGKDM